MSGDEEDEFIEISSVGKIPYWIDPDARIDACVRLAWVYYAQVAANPVEPVQLRLEGPYEFGAYVGKTADRDDNELVIDRACLHFLDGLWSNVELSAPQPADPSEFLAPLPFEWSNLTLFWLALHEIGHLHQGHLELLSGVDAGFRDGAGGGLRLGLRNDARTLLLDRQESEHRFFQCLELQADTLATRCFLGIYKPQMTLSDLADIRCCALAAMSAMLLIERADAGDHRTIEGQGNYPSPAVRLFVLMGVISQHAFQVLRRDYETGSKQQLKVTTPDYVLLMDAYRDRVMLPLFAQLHDICMVLGGEGYFDFLGFTGNLITDVARWTEAGAPEQASFSSAGARECARLFRLDDDIRSLVRPTS